MYLLLGKLLSPFAQLGFKVHTALFHTPRARVMVWNEHDEILLVRNWAGKPQWGLPGGGLKKNEAADHAACRELYEETGIVVAAEDLRLVGTIKDDYEAVIFNVRIRAEQLPARAHNPWEITAIGWHSESALPPDLSRITRRALDIMSKRG